MEIIILWMQRVPSLCRVRAMRPTLSHLSVVCLLLKNDANASTIVGMQLKLLNN